MRRLSLNAKDWIGAFRAESTLINEPTAKRRFLGRILYLLISYWLLNFNIFLNTSFLPPTLPSQVIFKNINIAYLTARNRKVQSPAADFFVHHNVIFKLHRQATHQKSLLHFDTLKSNTCHFKATIMPSPFPSSFASAAAGNPSTEGGANGRNTGSGDWYVTQALSALHPTIIAPSCINLTLVISYFRTRARTNGATQTFRRPSVATNLSQPKESSQSNNIPTPSSANVYVPPHLNSNYQSSYNRNGPSNESRYSKDQLLDLFRTQDRNGFTNTRINDLHVDGWSPGTINGTSNGGWGKRDDNKEVAGPDICWDREGSVNPMAMQEVTEEEKEVYRMVATAP